MLRSLPTAFSATAVGLAVVVAGSVIVLHVPKHSCSVSWFDSEGRSVDHLPRECPAHLDTRRIGQEDYVLIKDTVYRVRVGKSSEPARFLQCMTGVACIPIPSQATVSTRMDFDRLEGYVAFDKLHALGDDRYVSDGRSIFYGTARLTRVVPPIDTGKLAMPACPAPGSAAREKHRSCKSPYATDGRHVLMGAQRIEGADAATFRANLPELAPDGTSDDMRPLAADKYRVYAGAAPLAGADPATFGVLRAARTIASDAGHAWTLGPNDTFVPMDVTPGELAGIRRELAAAQTTNAARHAIR